MHFLQKKAYNLVEMGEPIEKFWNLECECSAKNLRTKYGTNDADCIHTCLNKVRKIDTPEIIIDQIENEINYFESDMKWSSNNKNIKKKHYK